MKIVAIGDRYPQIAEQAAVCVGEQSSRCGRRGAARSGKRRGERGASIRGMILATGLRVGETAGDGSSPRRLSLYQMAAQ